MASEDDNYGYGAMFASKEELENLVNLLSETIAEENRRFLEFNVGETDYGLVEGKAKTWMQFSNEQAGKLAPILEDDEGIFELNFYDLTVEGVGECLMDVYNQQKEADEDKFKVAVIGLIDNL